VQYQQGEHGRPDLADDLTFDEVQATEGDLQEQHRVDHQPDQVRGGHGQQSAALRSGW